MQENYPFLISRKALKADHENLKKICITSVNFTLGRNLKNSVVVPIITISRNHCTFRKSDDNEWYIEDHSASGIDINGVKLGKGASKKLSHEDVIALDPLQELVYKFVIPSCDTYETPRKKIKIESKASKEECDSSMIENMKLKFEESQTVEIKHIESKIESAKQMQTTSKILKDQLQLDMNRKMQQLEANFAQQIENLQGEKNEVEQQKALLLEERDAQLAAVKAEMEGKIAELMEQIKKHNESESELLKENNLLKEKLLKEREDFLSELSRESSSKQDMLDKLEARVREQEEVRMREKQELEDMLRKETEHLRLAKEKELKELEEQKRQREWELVEELNSMRRNLEEQVEQTEQQRLKAEQELNDQVEQMKKLSDEEKVKMSQLIKEREEIQNKLREAEVNAEKAHEELKEKVKAREVELAALASERIQQQAEQSSVVINSLQEQLERVKAQLQSVETEKNTLLSNFAVPDVCEGSSKESALASVGELMDSELQCSICAEQFVCATTLGCSHTFCKYCITMWKKKKKDCPICRTPITSEVKNLVLDSFIEKMAQNLTEEVKKKRQDILKYREEQIAQDARKAQSTPTTTGSRRRRTPRNRTTATTTTTSSAISTLATPTTTGRSAGHTSAPTASIPTVDLTGIPLTPAPTMPLRTLPQPPQVTLAPRPPPAPPITITRLPLPLQQVQVYQVIRQNGQTLMVVPGGQSGVSFPASQASTTAGTGAASAAGSAATGRPGAPSGSPARPHQ